VSIFGKKTQKFIFSDDINLGKIYEKSFFDTQFKAKNVMADFLAKSYGNKVLEMRKSHYKKITGIEIANKYFQYFKRTPLLLIITRDSSSDKIVVFFIDISSHDNLDMEMFHFLLVDSIADEISKINYIIQTFSSSNIDGVDLITDVDIPDKFIDLYDINAISKKDVLNFSKRVDFFESNTAKIKRLIRHSIFVVVPILAVTFIYNSYIGGLIEEQKAEQNILLLQKQEIVSKKRELKKLDIYLMKEKSLSQKVVK
jgi:hypothetical protein